MSGADGRPRAVVVGHDWVAGELGLLAPWLDARGFSVARAPRESADLAGAGDGADLVVLMGSPWSWAVPSDDPRVGESQEREQQLIRAALGAGTPLLGICYGAQALAIAVGGRATRLPDVERGWMTLDARPPMPAGPWMVWHEDAFHAPAGVEVLARSDRAELALRTGSAWGVQFHLEVDAPILQRMGRALGAAEDVVAEMVAGAERVEAQHAANTRTLLDAFWAAAGPAVQVRA